MAYLYPYGDTQQLNLDWLIEQWNEVKSQIDGSLQAEIDRVEAAITDLLTARDEAVAAQTAAQASAQAAAGSASTASGAASTATAQAQAAAGSAATAGAQASDAQGYAATAQQAAQAANNSAGAAAVSEGNARNSETAAAGSSSAAAGNALYAEGYAKGTQNGNPVSSGSPYYENNAKYYSDHAAQDAQDAQDAATLLQPPATSADIGKALIVKTVGGGTVTSYELGESGGGGSTPGLINTIENVPVASFDDGLNSPIHQIIVDIEPVQDGSGDPDPDNVRPIYGWTGANVHKTGKNILPNNPNNFSTIGSYIIYKTGIPDGVHLYINCTDNDTSVSLTGISFGFISSNYLSGSVQSNQFKWIISNGTLSAVHTNITQDNLNRVGSFVCYPNTSEAITKVFQRYNIMVVVGDSAESYEAYTGTTYPITFPSEAGTVYGGTLTNQGSDEWKLKIDRAKRTLNGSENWTAYTAQNGFILGITGMAQLQNVAEMSALSAASWLKNIGGLASYGILFNTNSVIYCCHITDNISGITDLTTWKAYLSTNNLEIVYPIATPVEYTITTTEIVTLLAEYNNVWADTGNIDLLQYYADSKKYIDDQDTLIKALIAKELPDMTADAALVANDFRIVNNTLYRVTAPIASGGTLTPGTNCTATTITEVLKSLL